MTRQTLEYAFAILIMFICYGTIAHILLFAWYSKHIGAAYNPQLDSKYWQDVEKSSACWIAVCATGLTILFKWGLL